MAKQDLGKILPTFNGIYNANIVYEKLCIVNYNGSVYVSKKDIPKGTDISNEEYWYLLIEKLKKGIDYFTEEDRKAIIDEVTKLAESDFNKYYDEKKKALDKVASDNTTAFLKAVKDNTTDFNSNVDTQTKAFDTHYDEKVKSFDENSDKQTKAYDINANNKLNDYNENHKTKMQELDDEATVKIAEYDKHSEELRNMAVSTDNELERVKNEILDTGSASDSFIHIEDSCMAKIKELEIEGVINQKTTTGKNLLDYISNLRTSSNGLTNTLNEDGSITTTGKPNINYSAIIKNINITDILEDKQKYIISQEKKSNKVYIQIIAKKVDGTYTYVNNIYGNNSFKVDKTIYATYNIVIQANTIDAWGDTSLTVTNKYMLYKETNTTDTSFEPYTGGQPSPNPDYPQEIKTITNSLNITSCNKNIFNFNETKNLKKYNCDYKYENDILELTQTSQWTYVSCDIKVKPNTTYVYSFEMDFEGINRPSNWWLSLNDTKGTTYNKNLVSFINDKIYKIFNTTNSNTLQILFTGSTTTIPTKTIFKNIQLEENPSLTDFEQNLLSKIEAKLPEGEFIGKINDTYKDTLRAEYNKDDGQYHLMLDKMIGKYTFTGNENWATYTQSNGIPIFRCTLPASGYFAKSNYFVSQTTWSTLLEENRIFNHVGNYQNIEIACSKFDTLTNFENFITTNVVQMYHGLATPYIVDLGPIDMPLSYKGITNIFTDSDLLPKITAKYYRTFEKTIQNMQINEKSLKQEITDLNNNISDITKRLEALESANASTVEENEVSNDLQN